ncbi:MAG TPA: crosslink repair DNA glycosylase YcaQ family protein [Anaerolineae bacterium]|nr:crosslink repair DNA glycosylase YcaQ family protein [Anaerolineae bacterium]
MDTVTIAPTTARRFVLGRQGLWPGRRWAGVEGAAEALTAMEGLQLDPLNVAARSQDIALWGRVQDYRPEHLHQVAYDERRFFDYGGWLFLYPMAELPYWRPIMQQAGQEGRWARWAAQHADVLDEVKVALRARGPLGNRDFAGNKRVNSYRGRKDTSLALYSLWITGELMIHHRVGFDRVYDFRHNVAPAHLHHVVSQHEAERYFARKLIAFYGLFQESSLRGGLGGYLWRTPSLDEARGLLHELLQAGVVVRVCVDGSKNRLLALREDLPLLATLEASGVPSAWQPLAATTRDEVTFLAPLDIVSARGRAKRLFDFEYKWEVYTPAAQRRWGYYTLPILYGDRLVGRLDPKLDRKSMTLHVNGFWLEEHAPTDDPAFARALARGLTSFAAFVEARELAINAGLLRDLIGHIL